MKKFRHIILALTALILASCAVDEFWEGMDHAEGEEVVMTFKPKFEDFESVTKAIGDGSQVDQLLVHVYEEGSDKFEEETYDITNCQVQQEVKIPFYYGKKYKVYFWAYKSGNDSPYTILPNGLKGGVSVEYPDGALDFDALESLDAFYAVSDVDLSNGRTMDINLTRPFAQVNLVADKTELLNAQATKVEFTINVAETFNLTSPTSEGTTGKTFTFTSTDNFQNTEEINGNVYLGTTYLFVPLSGKVTGKVKLYAGDNVLKSAENIEIPLVGNKRTNLVFSGFQVTVPDWEQSKETVPGESGGWITITEPEQLAALLMAGTTESTQVRIGEPLNMEKMPAGVKSNIAGKSFNGLTLDGNGLTIKNYEAPAFFATATNLNVSNLTLENVKISAVTHVGVLVNELHGNGTFTNVTVKGSSATTNSGAAGGFVGRSVRIYEMERSETLALTFTGCRIEGTDDKKIVATGSLAEGMFVGLFSGYDNGEKLVFTSCTTENASVTDWTSPYIEGNEGAWLASNDYSSYDGWLGDEVYYRGKVYFGGENEATNRFCPKWDGTTTVEPIYEDESMKIAQIWSAFDLAYLQDKSITTINFNENVDLNSKVFTPIKSLSNIDGASKILYNLTVDTMQLESSSSMGGAFVRGISNGTVKNLIFEGAHINVAYDPNGISGNAYAGTLAATVSGTTTITGVNCLNGSVHAICKMGGLIGRVSDGKLTCKDCHVENYQISNEKAPDKYKETFTETAQVQTTKNIIVTFTIDLTATAEASFNSEGEVGGLIGFIIGSADIDDCTVSNTTINAFGQLDDHSGVHAVGTAKYKILWTPRTANLDLVADYTIAGRHVNKFIGDIKPTSGEIVTIDNCTADAIRTDDSCFWNSHTCKAGTFDLVGCAYYIGGKVQMDGIDMGKTFGESKGSVKIDGVEILDEAIANISISDVLEDLI